MKPVEIITHLKSRGARLYVKGEKLLCDAPKHSIEPELLKAIKANKAELIALIAEDNHGDGGNDEPEIRTIKREKTQPLSFAQKRMMVLHSMQTDHGVFNISLAFELKGKLDSAKLNNALKKVADRHELLRTRFTRIIDEPVQEIRHETTLNVTQIDLRHAEGGASEGLPLDILRQEHKRPFDVSRAPLFRAVLVRRTHDDFILLLVSHYLIADEASMVFIAKEIRDYYNEKPGNETDADNRQFQYVDYVSWEHAFLRSPAGKNQLRFWLDRFKKYKHTEQQKRESASKFSRMFDGVSANFELSSELTSALERISRENQVSLFMVTYAIFTILIANIYERNAFFCGSPIVNRSRMELENMVGYFANTLVLKSDLSDEQAFVELLKVVRSEVMTIFSNGDIPFEYALEKAGVNAYPFTRFMFTYTEDNFAPPQFDHLSTCILKAEENSTMNVVTELSLFIRKVENQLFCSFLYARERFEPTTIKGLVHDFAEIAETIVKFPQSTVAYLKETCKANKSGLVAFNKRLALDQVTPHNSDPSAYKAPGNEMEKMLISIWEGILNVNKISTTDNFFSLGGSSFQAVKMFSAINRKIGVNLPISTLFNAPTIEFLAKSVKGKENDRQWSSIVPIQAKGTRPPLFFVHGAGGNVLLYRELSLHLGGDQPFYGFQAQGLDGKKPYLKSFEEMAARYIDEMQSLQPDGPYCLGGYCLGGTIALEMARQLSGQGQEVVLLAMIETYNAHSGHGITPSYYDVLHPLQNLKYHWENFWVLSMRGKRMFLSKKITTELERMKLSIGIAFSQVAQRLHIPMGEKYPHINLTKINDQINMEYIPKSYKGKITLFRPQKHYAGYNKEDFGWREVAQGGVDIHTLTVNPRGALVEPYVQELARELKQCIENSAEGFG